jgi:hypothetical protein
MKFLSSTADVQEISHENGMERDGKGGGIERKICTDDEWSEY